MNSLHENERPVRSSKSVRWDSTSLALGTVLKGARENSAVMSGSNQSSEKSRRIWYAIGAAILLIVLSTGLVIGLPWYRHIQVSANVRMVGGRVHTVDSFGLTWLRDIAGNEFMAPIGGIHVGFFDHNVTDAELANLRGLRNVKSLAIYGPNVTDAALVHVRELAGLEHLTLARTNVTDAGLMQLAELTNLSILTLSETKVGDAGLIHLKKLTNLRILDLNKTNVTDAGLAHIEGLKNLRFLYLRHTCVSDAGLPHLTGLTNLTELNLYFTGVTIAAGEEMQTLLPNCAVHGKWSFPF
jgi:Leucine-rich repeat (LRR) protein